MQRTAEQDRALLFDALTDAVKWIEDLTEQYVDPEYVRSCTARKSALLAALQLTERKEDTSDSDTVRVRFESIGRGKKTWEDDVREDPSMPGTPDLDAVVTALRKGKALMSSDIDVSCSDEKGKHGPCYAGLHPVGTWRVVDGGAT